MSSTKTLRKVVPAFDAKITRADRHPINEALFALALPTLGKAQTFDAYLAGLTDAQRTVLAPVFDAPAPTGYVKAKIRAHTAAKKAAAAQAARVLVTW